MIVHPPEPESDPTRATWRRDIALYGAIGGLTAAQTFVASGDLPKAWSPWLGIAMGVLIAIKAKLSNGHPKD